MRRGRWVSDFLCVKISEDAALPRPLSELMGFSGGVQFRAAEKDGIKARADGPAAGDQHLAVVQQRGRGTVTRGVHRRRRRREGVGSRVVESGAAQAVV